ncbi:dTMP kinase [bacterium]|nr:dTMP kinase [bacterium]
MQKSTRGKFIVIDGMDGSGKGTQMDLLKTALAEKPAVFTREPWGIRDVLLGDFGARADILTHFFLHFADKNEHMRQVVIPALMDGSHVISDRGISSTWTFQVELSEKKNLRRLFKTLSREVYESEDVHPDLFLILDLRPEISRERALRRGGAKNHYDVQPVEYYAKIHKGYRNFAREGYPVRFIDAKGTPEEIHKRVLSCLHRAFPLHF